MKKYGSAVVLKAGGALLKNTTEIDKMALVIEKYKKLYDAIFFICSAMGDETDLLLKLIKNINSRFVFKCFKH